MEYVEGEDVMPMGVNNNKKMIDRFFKDNPCKKEAVPSPAAMANFQIKLLLNRKVNEEFQDKINDLVLKEEPEREGPVKQEKNEIETAGREQIIRIMRRSPDPMNQHILVYRAMEFEDGLIPEVVRMMKTSLNTGFIETATRVLSVCRQDIADELVAYFNDVRSPYAQSMILVVLGFKADEKHVPWIIEKYKELKRNYPDESYCDGAVYALSEIENRFYPIKERG